MRFELDKCLSRERRPNDPYPHSVVFRSEHFVHDFRQLDEIHMCAIS
jgi:hypothetical protein